MAKLMLGLLLLKLDENKTTVLTVVGLMLITISVTAFALTSFNPFQVLGLAVGNISICFGAKLMDRERK